MQFRYLPYSYTIYLSWISVISYNKVSGYLKYGSVLIVYVFLSLIQILNPAS